SEIDPQILRRLTQMKQPDCLTVKELGEFLDERVDAERKASIEKHLRACPACLNQLIELRELAWLQTHGPEPSADLLKKAISMVRGEVRSSSVGYLEAALHTQRRRLFDRAVSTFASIERAVRANLGSHGTQGIAALLAGFSPLADPIAESSWRHPSETQEQ